MTFDFQIPAHTGTAFVVADNAIQYTVEPLQPEEVMETVVLRGRANSNVQLQGMVDQEELK